MQIETIEVNAKDLLIGDVIIGRSDCRLVVDKGKTLLHSHKTCKLQYIFYAWGNATNTSTVEELNDKREGKPFTVIRLANLVR